jgi:hypothetical protein
VSRESAPRPSDENGARQVKLHHLEYLLKGNTSVDVPPNPFKSAQLSDKSWGDVYALSQLDGFKGLVDHMHALDGPRRRVSGRSSA